MTYAKFGSEPSKDRWHQLADAIQDSNLPASDKAIFRYLLDKADYMTAAANPKFAVLQRTIGKKTSISLRQVIYSLEHLAQHGWVAVGKAHEDKRRTTYTLSAGWACDCTGRRHVADQSVTSATQSVTARKVQHRRSEDVPIADVAVVTDVAHSAGDGFPAISADARKVQPDGQIGATPAPYIGATDRCNAAGQTPLPTERHREEGVKGSAEKQEPVKLKPPPGSGLPAASDPVGTSSALPRLPRAGGKRMMTMSTDHRAGPPATAGQPGADLLAVQNGDSSAPASIEDQRRTRPRTRSRSMPRQAGANDRPALRSVSVNEFQRKLSAALAAQHKRQRSCRGKRATGIAAVRQAGMVRQAPRDGDGQLQDGRADRRGQRQAPGPPIPGPPGTPGAA